MTQFYNNITRLLNKYFYQTEEKPVKYNEWLTSEYVNGKWYICEENVPPVPTILDMGWEIETDEVQSNYLYFVVIASRELPNEIYNNIELNTTDFPNLSYDYFYYRIYFEANQSLPNSYTIICTIPTTTINNNIYIGCQIIWTGSEVIIQ